MTAPASKNDKIRLGNVVALPPSPHTAQAIAHHLRSAGFYSLPVSVWSNAADLAEVLKDEPPTVSQRIWLWQTHQRFLQ